MEKYSFITQEELRSLLYYQGAVEKIQLNSSELELRKFYSINNAYETINMLLFPGIENEKSRLWTEKRRIDEQILDNMDELLNVYLNTISVIINRLGLLQAIKKNLKRIVQIRSVT